MADGRGRRPTGEMVGAWGWRPAGPVSVAPDSDRSRAPSMLPSRNGICVNACSELGKCVRWVTFEGVGRNRAREGMVIDA